MSGSAAGKSPDKVGLRTYLLLIAALVIVLLVGGGLVWLLRPPDGGVFAITAFVVVALALALFGACLLVAREIRARTAAEVRTAESGVSQRRFRQIMENAPLEISFVGVDGKFVAISRAVEDLWQITDAAARGKSVYDLLPKPEADVLAGFDAEVLRTRAPIQREASLSTPQGRRTFLVVRFPVLDSAGAIEAVGSIAADVTLQRNAEQAMVRMQRLDAVGKLTGGFAHDFNNLLTVILGNAEQMLESSEPADRELAESIIEAADRGADLTRRLLAFARRQSLEPRVTDVNALVRAMEPLLHRTLGEHIEVTITTADDLRNAIIDPSQLEIAIVSLAANAGDAMEPGGRLTIETGNVDLDEAYAQVNAEVKPGPYVMIAVGDTGSGMTPEVMARAFEPFFTTRAQGKGTGLGLSSIYGFMKQSDGHVRIYSEVGMGTIVRLYLPAARADGLVEPPAAEETVLPRGTESILLVEDNAQVRANIERQLGELGYKVIAVANAVAALDIVGETMMPDLLITDMVMPGGMNGIQLAEALHQRFPDLKVLFMSGYAHGVAPAPLNGMSEKRHFLGKPFRRRDLAGRVRAVLDGAPPPTPNGINGKH